MCENEIRSFLTYLACDKYVSSSTQNQALNAIILGIRFAIVGSTAPAKKIFHSQDYQLEDGVNIFRTIS